MARNNKSHGWTEEERQYIRDNIGDKSYFDMAAHLGLTVPQVDGAVQRLGLRGVRNSKLKEKVNNKKEFYDAISHKSQDGESLCITCANFFTCGFHPMQGQKRKRVWDLGYTKFQYTADSRRYPMEVILECRLYQKGRQPLDTRPFTKWQEG